MRGGGERLADGAGQRRSHPTEDPAAALRRLLAGLAPLPLLVGSAQPGRLHRVVLVQPLGQRVDSIGGAVFFALQQLQQLRRRLAAEGGRRPLLKPLAQFLVSAWTSSGLRWTARA